MVLCSVCFHAVYLLSAFNFVCMLEPCLARLPCTSYYAAKIFVLFEAFIVPIKSFKYYSCALLPSHVTTTCHGVYHDDDGNDVGDDDDDDENDESCFLISWFW